jgi:branched-chain amino acid transport system ATP-binding protein
VLESVSLDLHPGEVTCLLGANGAGKSTLIMTIAGVLPASDGSIELDGASLAGHAPEAIRGRGVAVVPEGHRVLANLSVLDNLRAAGSPLSWAALKEEIDRVIAIFPELRPRLSLDASLLSGGQKQMLAIGQALIARPRYLLIDELSFGLAPAVVIRLGETIREIARRNIGILLVEQLRHLLWHSRVALMSWSGGAWSFPEPPMHYEADPRFCMALILRLAPTCMNGQHNDNHRPIRAKRAGFGAKRPCI